KDAETLERSRAVTTVAFDKTGTLTSGRPKIVHLQARNVEEEQVLALAGALQRGSEHPLARAVLERCAEAGIEVPTVQDSQALPGRGIAGSVGGRQLRLGSQRLLSEAQLEAGELAALASAWEAEGRTLSWLLE